MSEAAVRVVTALSDPILLSETFDTEPSELSYLSFLGKNILDKSGRKTGHEKEGAPVGTASNPGTPNPDQIKKVQQALKDKSFYSGPVDGVMSKSTQEAIRTLQKSKNLDVTGNLDDKTARELGLGA